MTSRVTDGRRMKVTKCAALRRGRVSVPLVSRHQTTHSRRSLKKYRNGFQINILCFRYSLMLILSAAERYEIKCSVITITFPVSPRSKQPKERSKVEWSHSHSVKFNLRLAAADAAQGKRNKGTKDDKFLTKKSFFYPMSLGFLPSRPADQKLAKAHSCPSLDI